MASGRTVLVWDWKAEREVHVYSDPPAEVRTVAFSPAGDAVMAGGKWYGVKMWRLADGASRTLSKVEMARSMTLVRGTGATPGGYEDLALWEKGPRGDRDRIMISSADSIHVSPDGKLLASSGGMDPVSLFRTADHSLEKKLIGHSSSVRAVAFAPDGRELASSAMDGTVRLWELATGEELQRWDVTPDPHLNSDPGAESICFSPEGARLAAVASDGTLSIWRR
jgi:WD40 repeat protein